MAAGADLCAGASRMSRPALTDHITGPAFLLVAGRTAGLIATFAIGPLLARLLTLEEIRHLPHVLPSLRDAASDLRNWASPRASTTSSRARRSCRRPLRRQCGVDADWVRARWPGAALGGRGRVLPRISATPSFPDYLVLLGVFLTLMLVTTVFEILMVSRKQHVSAARDLRAVGRHADGVLRRARADVRQPSRRVHRRRGLRGRAAGHHADRAAPRRSGS